VLREAQGGGGSGEVRHGRMIWPGSARGQFLGVICEHARGQQLGAFMDEAGRLLPDSSDVDQLLEGVLADLRAAFDVPGSDIAARLREPQLALELGRVQDVRS
jgi:hypothetical protein